MTAAPAKKSDLGVRTASAAIMVAIAGLALWQGGVVLDAFILLVALVVLWEFTMLVNKIARTSAGKLAALAGAIAYVAGAALALIAMPEELLVVVIGTIICVDTGAYFVGRAIGGPRIAPAISPSKTWAGLGGGILGASLWFMVLTVLLAGATSGLLGGAKSPDAAALMRIAAIVVPVAAVVTIVAQAGDFFESWLKRRAGVKDSSGFIPGHGGVFDRVDGLLPVAIIVGLVVGWIQ